MNVVLWHVASGQQRHTIVAGDFHLLVVKDGALFSFGRVHGHCLGHSDTANQHRPKRVVALANESMHVATGDYRSLVLTAAGALFSSVHGLFTCSTGPRRPAMVRVVNWVTATPHTSYSRNGWGVRGREGPSRGGDAMSTSRVAET